MKNLVVTGKLILVLIFFGITTTPSDCAKQKYSKNDEDINKRLGDQIFDTALTHENVSMTDHTCLLRLSRLRKDLTALLKHHEGIKSNKDKFIIKLDVHHFLPEEVTVMAVDGTVVIEAKHEERQEQHGSVSREFKRKYALPKDVDAENLVFKISKDSILTVTAPRKVIRKETKKPLDSCQEPVKDACQDLDECTRYNSRIEYGMLPERQVGGFALTVEFRTSDEDGGLIFYATSKRSPEQFLALYMRDAQLHFKFNCGERTASRSLPQKYNDTEWHTARMMRYRGYGKLTVDNEHVAEASVSCADAAVLTPPYYYGGLGNVSMHYKETVGFYRPFKGCLKTLLMNGQYVTNILYRDNALRCIDSVEDGVYFEPAKDGHSSYLKLMNHFKVGNDISISMEVKPRNTTGLLLSVHGKQDYLIIELLENEVVLNVENGEGAFHASYKLGDKFSLCDGKWHTIHAVKTLHVISVGVDGYFSDGTIGRGSSTDTTHGLFIGGHERQIHRLPGVKTKTGFVGCIKNIFIEEKRVEISAHVGARNVHIGACPIN